MRIGLDELVRELKTISGGLEGARRVEVLDLCERVEQLARMEEEVALLRELEGALRGKPRTRTVNTLLLELERPRGA